MRSGGYARVLGTIGAFLDGQSAIRATVALDEDGAVLSWHTASGSTEHRRCSQHELDELAHQARRGWQSTGSGQSADRRSGTALLSANQMTRSELFFTVGLHLDEDQVQAIGITESATGIRVIGSRRGEYRNLFFSTEQLQHERRERRMLDPAAGGANPGTARPLNEPAPAQESRGSGLPERLYFETSTDEVPTRLQELEARQEQLIARVNQYLAAQGVVPSQGWFEDVEEMLASLQGGPAHLAAERAAIAADIAALVHGLSDTLRALTPLDPSQLPYGIERVYVAERPSRESLDRLEDARKTVAQWASRWSPHAPGWMGPPG